MKKYLEQYLGQPIAILAVRHWYRGILTKLEDEHLVISNGFGVELTGDLAGTVPRKEEALTSDAMISLMSVEMVYQPVWAFHGYSKKELKRS